MDRDRRIAVAVGVFYIIGTVAGILSVVLTGPVLDVPDYLSQVASQSNRLILAGLCVLAMALSLAMVPIVIYPVLKRHDPTLALGYIVFRGALETTTYIITVVGWLALITFAREIVGGGDVQDLSAVATGATLREAGDWIGTVGTVVFSIGALMLYTVLFRSRLIPRWISGWGALSIALCFPSALLVLFGVVEPTSTPYVVLNLPLAVQEMVMAVWLIAKGFRPVEPLAVR